MSSSYDYDLIEEPSIFLNPIVILSGLAAFGIYFLFQRYEKVRFRAVPFSIKPPAVSTRLPNMHVEELTTFQAAASNWSSITIANPTLESHIMNAGLLPAKKNALLAALAAVATQQQPSGKSQYITCFDPSTGYHLDTYPADSEMDIAEKIDLARRAWAKSRWAESSFGERKRVMRSLLRWVVKNRETCARVACRDTGKTSEFTAVGVLVGT